MKKFSPNIVIAALTAASLAASPLAFAQGVVIGQGTKPQTQEERDRAAGAKKASQQAKGGVSGETIAAAAAALAVAAALASGGSSGSNTTAQ